MKYLQWLFTCPDILTNKEREREKKKKEKKLVFEPSTEITFNVCI